MASDLKRYPPTAQRLQRLREAGIVPHSPALTALCSLAAAGLVGGLLWPGASAQARQFAAACWSSPGVTGSAEAQARCAAGMWLVLEWVGLVGLAGAGVGWLSHLLQTGFAWGSVFPREKRRGLPSPRPGVGREACMAGLSLLVAGVSLARVLQTMAGPGEGMAGLVARCARTGLEVALPGFVGIALLDLAWRRAQFSRDAWMTETEMRDELRETESAWRRHVRGAATRAPKRGGTA
jgi:flagellar biosynthesis protein FlhB